MKYTVNLPIIQFASVFDRYTIYISLESLEVVDVTDVKQIYEKFTNRGA